ncbi:MAG: ribonuclease III [Candidatus Neomarinimicrobiota bacterium]|nr:ribonuclease III [Candidatus Neomarinimicrobiota bacterium]MEC9273720.1 ribonuclease III [Candidatus Neomarinimicrobiota bacterium]MEE3196368.1 ribonuclease III [Candidatus Neomarinimicrobiota bacterium]
MTAIIDYRFNNIEYLEQAFTHRSISSEPRENYERLEFLGDAVIDIIISRELMRYYPDGDEGLLTKKRAALVRQSFLSIIGNILDIMDYLIVEPNVDLNNEKVVNKQRANLVEALIGAIYLDGGIKPAKKMIINTIWKYREQAWKAINYKGKLIEYCHANGINNPKFHLVNVSGPDHQKTFEIHVSINGSEYPTGIGTDKKTAEQSAAQNALMSLIG